MISGKRLARTAPCKLVEICKVRPTADASRLLLARCELATFSYPDSHTLRRACQWQSAPPATIDLTRVAIHEAGHVVMMEWIGMTGLSATATPTSGQAHFPIDLHNLPDPGPDATGQLAATAASIFHGGMMAELLFAGIEWVGPIWYPKQLDHIRAEKMLLTRFGRHSSAAHAFAQKVALHVLHARRARVQEIAAHLVAYGSWQSESPVPFISNRKKVPLHG